MATKERMTCQKCGRVIPETNFFKKKDGTRFDYCKDCLTTYIKNDDPSTFDWILKEFDVPYIEPLWVSVAQAAYLRNPGTFSNKSVIGRYIRTTNMNPWRKWRYADSDAATEHWVNIHGRDNIVSEEKKAEFKAKLDAGEITLEQYRTLTGDNQLLMAYHEPLGATATKKEKILLGLDKASPEDHDWDEATKQKLSKKQAFHQVQQQIAEMQEKKEEAALQNAVDTMMSYMPTTIDENEMQIKNSLTSEDIKYLTIKWGASFTPSEWVQMENLYNKYTNTYEMNVDREEALKKICRTSIKMDKALEIEDFTSYKNLAGVLDQLRKSAKFTEAQNKEEQEAYIDSVGELVAAVERELEPGTFIDQFRPGIDAKEDKVDFTLKDMQAYTRNLVKNEMGLGDLIESYIQKLEESEKAQKEADANYDALLTQSAYVEEEEDDGELEAELWTNNLDDMIASETEQVFAQVGGDNNGS